MTPLHLAILVAYSFGLALGQCMFKLAAERARAPEGHTFFAALLTSWHFYASITLYAVLTLLWIWILSRVPLSRAYPFVALAFIFTPVLSSLMFGERIDAWYMVGLAAILGGLGIIVVKAS